MNIKYITLLLATASTASAQLLTNGTFAPSIQTAGSAFSSELANIATTTSSATVNGWTFSSNAGIYNGDTTNGKTAAWLNPLNRLVARFDQQVSLSVGSYQLDFDSFAQELKDGEGVSHFSVLIEDAIGTQAFFSNYKEIVDNKFTNRTAQFDITKKGSYNIRFYSTGNAVGTGNDTLIDNAVLTSVPEPSSTLLLGLASLVGITRRKR